MNQLAAGMPAENLNRLLGPCAIRRSVTDLSPLPASQRCDVPSLRQLIFMTKHACIDAYVESTLDTVVAFSITVTNPRFTPDVSRLTFGTFAKLRLGQATFAHPSIPPDRDEGAFWWNGARDVGYAEAHYGANPGGYQHYVLAHLQTGTGSLAYDEAPRNHMGGLRSGLFAIEPALEEPDKQRLDGPRDFAKVDVSFKPEAWKWFRAKTTINTVQVLGPGWLWTLTRPGVHGDVTRLLREPPKSTLDHFQAWRRDAAIRREIRRTERRDP